MKLDVRHLSYIELVGSASPDSRKKMTTDKNTDEQSKD